MSLELPGWVADAFNLIGLPWPGIDEDQLRGWARDVRDYAAEMESVSERSRSAITARGTSDRAAFAVALASKWEHHSGVIGAMRAPLDDFADVLDAAAGTVVAQKMVVIGAAVALAGEVIATQGEALVTFGLAEAEVPAEVAAARLIVRPEGNLIAASRTGERAATPVPGQTGGGSIRPQVNESFRSDLLNRQWANAAYDSIRASDDVADVARNVRDAPRLDGSTGFTLEEIQAVKAQVFYDEHPLDGGDGRIVYSRFDADADMAEAWLRLRSGKYKPQDLVLLEHELAERNYWEQHPGVVYWEAHRVANGVAFWSADLPRPTYEDYTKPWK